MSNERRLMEEQWAKPGMGSAVRSVGWRIDGDSQLAFILGQALPMKRRTVKLRRTKQK